MKDKIIRGIVKGKNIRFLGVDATDTTREAAKIHNLSTTNIVIMGRMIGAALMLGSDLKSARDKLTLKIDSIGSVKKVIAVAKNDGSVKTLIDNPSYEQPLNPETKRIDIKSALGKGNLQIIKDMGLKNSYKSQIELKYGEIAQDLAYYFAKSEQIPTSIGLGVLVMPGGEIKQAGGFIIQVMPGAKAEDIDLIEKNIRSFPNLTDVMDMGYKIEKILTNFILKNLKVEIKKTIHAKYHCECNLKKMEKVIKTLGEKEIRKNIDMKKPITVLCDFCQDKYIFSPKKLSEILKK